MDVGKNKIVTDTEIVDWMGNRYIEGGETGLGVDRFYSVDIDNLPTIIATDFRGAITQAILAENLEQQGNGELI